MNSFVLIVPLLMIRFFVLGFLNKEAIKEATYFAPMEGREQWAYYIYQVSNLGLLLLPIFNTIKLFSLVGYVGLGIYILGLIILLCSTIDFAKASKEKLRTHGIYRFSRNPMYLGYFFCYLGCGFLMYSYVFLITLMVFQISAHWIILAEERWCQQEFGKEYLSYAKKVRRYV